MIQKQKYFRVVKSLLKYRYHSHLHQNHIGCLLKIEFWKSYLDLMNEDSRVEELKMEKITENYISGKFLDGSFASHVPSSRINHISSLAPSKPLEFVPP